MSMKVTVKDFQSISKVNFEIDGFTVIVGRSNIGKSALIRSISGALHNRAGTSFVRQGETCAEVSIVSPEVSVGWKKGKQHNDFVVNGEAFESVGRAAPPPIQDAGFKPISLSRGDIQVQVASQFEPIFLLDSSKVSGSLAAEAVSDIGRVGELQKALDTAAKDHRSVKSTLKVRRSDLTTAVSDSQRFAPVEAIEEDAERLWEARAKLKTLLAEIQFIRDLKDAYEEAEKHVKAFEGLPSPSSPPSWDSSLEKGLLTLREFHRLYETTLNEAETFSDLPASDLAPASFEEEGAPLWRGIVALRSFKEVWDKAVQGLSSLPKNVPTVPAFEEDALDDLDALRNMCVIYKATTLELGQTEALLDSTKQRLEEATEDLEQAFHELGHCPMCETHFD